MRLQPSPCCRTGGSPRDPRTIRSGSGTLRPDRDRPPRGPFQCGRGPLPAAGWSARVGVMGQDDPTLGRRGRGRNRPLDGHSGAVAALCLLPDGRLASGAYDNTIRLGTWRPGPRPPASRVIPARSPPFACCRTGGSPRAVMTTRSGSGRGGRGRDRRLDGHTDGVAALCLLPDGRLASGSWDKTIRLWDVAVGAETARLDGHSRLVAALCLLADGRLASGADDNTIRLWDVAAGAETARLDGHTDGVAALCLLPDGRLASGLEDDPALGRGGRGRDRPPRRSFPLGRRTLPAGGRAARLGRS